MVLGNPTTHNTYSHSYSLLLAMFVITAFSPWKRCWASPLQVNYHNSCSWVLAGYYQGCTHWYFKYLCLPSEHCKLLRSVQNMGKRDPHTHKAIKNTINPLGQNNTCETWTVYKSIYIYKHTFYSQPVFFFFIFSPFYEHLRCFKASLCFFDFLRFICKFPSSTFHFSLFNCC